MRPKVTGRTRSIGILLSAAFAVAVQDVAAGQESAVGDAASLSAVEQLVSEIVSIEGDTAYGEYLGGECVTCHQQSGAFDGIPPIVGHPAEYIVQALVEYKLGIRQNEVMRLRTSRLAKEEIAALAAYFGSLQPN